MKKEFTSRSMMLWGVSCFNTKILSEILLKSKILVHILTHWSVAQTGSNEKKTGGRKSRWTVP